MESRWCSDMELRGGAERKQPYSFARLEELSYYWASMTACSLLVSSGVCHLLSVNLLEGWKAFFNRHPHKLHNICWRKKGDNHPLIYLPQQISHWLNASYLWLFQDQCPIHSSAYFAWLGNTEQLSWNEMPF